VRVDLRQRLESALAGRYAVEREIGRGGMAIVFLARDIRHEREVALKVLRPELAASLGPERFLREIKLAAGLAHPHILPLYDSGDANGSLFYAMPFVTGDSLRDLLIKRTRLPLDTALQIAVEVADALDYAHERGIVHRDVKPENVLLQAGHAVVSDFGIARAISEAEVERVTATGLAVGTREYMSPEQAYGGESLDGRADIYGLGCVLYEMLSGRPPSGGTSPGGHHTPPPRSIRSGLSRVHPPVPPAVTELIVRALAENPSDRFPTAAALVEVLRAVPRTAVAAHRRPARWGTAGLLALLLVTAARFAWTAWRGNPASKPAAPVLSPTDVAVLYFEDRSEGGRLGPVAAGLTEDLIDRLGSVKVLRVKSPEGVRPYRSGGASLDSIARTLAVGTIIAGSVSGAGDLLRVVVRLIDGTNGVLLQSYTVQLPHRQLFELQDSITTDIAEFLRHRLGEAVALHENRAGTRSVAAWELVRRADAALDDGRSFERANATSEAATAYRQADTLLVQAEALDTRWDIPPLTRGWVARDLALLTPAPQERAAWLERGIAHANRVLSLTPQSPKALALRGQLRLDLWLQALAPDRDRMGQAAEDDLRAAVGAEPELARGWYALSLLLANRGRMVEADQAARQALESDAYLTEARGVMATLFFEMLYRERFEEARYWCKQGSRRFPDDPNFRPCELRVLGWSARGRAAIGRGWRVLDTIESRSASDESPLDPVDRRLMVAAVVARTGLRDSAQAILQRLHAQMSDSIMDQAAVEEAGVRVLLGERREAIQMLRTFLAGQPHLREGIGQNPWFRPLHGDPGFDSLVAVPP
jgi:TolB-like protein/tetratricopeptide (TPR) repeat protein